ncbi:3-keto-disaccharide hydrolase [Maribacter sp. X9]|uniref:3-keto-disaccharide hydrolase n=1 Tax=Maribacter sp. X9 TaxID=3402159 RepID=UPI003AF3CB5E
MHILKKKLIHVTRSIGIMVALMILFFCVSCADKSADPNEEEWIALFNGANYQDWTPKFTGSKLGINYKDRFVYEDSLLSVRYAKNDTFNGNFGHLFYKDKFSYYKLRAKYRFVGEQEINGPEWAIRNNGLMLHGQSPESMGLNQDFPISLELQLLGGYDNRERNTANLCTPGTNVMIADTLYTPHCINSVSKTYPGNQWVTVEALVLGDSLVQHIMEGEVVLEFTKPTIGGGNVEGYLESAFQEGKALTEGYISIQAETAPIDFKSIELLNLCGCMDKNAKNYKSYYIKPDAAACIYD